MTGFLYFLGNTLRWPVLKPKEFFSLHAYFSIIYLITFTLSKYDVCLLYTSDAADDLLCVDLGGRRIIKKKLNLGFYL